MIHIISAFSSGAEAAISTFLLTKAWNKMTAKLPSFFLKNFILYIEVIKKMWYAINNNFFRKDER